MSEESNETQKKLFRAGLLCLGVGAVSGSSALFGMAIFCFLVGAVADPDASSKKEDVNKQRYSGPS